MKILYIKIEDMKTALRIKAKNIRRRLIISDVSEKLVALIRKHPAYVNARRVMLFYPKKYEVDLRGLLIDGKEFYLPRVDGDSLVVCPYTPGDPLVPSRFQVSEPVTEPVDPSILDLMIVPALSVDMQCFRLGYGKGYYDRLLQSVMNARVKTICPVPVELMLETLPRDKFDVPVDYVICA